MLLFWDIFNWDAGILHFVMILVATFWSMAKDYKLFFFCFCHFLLEDSRCLSVLGTHGMCLSVLAAGTGWSGCQGMKFPLHVAESFRAAWRLRGCQALEQLCLSEAAGRVGASAHFSVSEPRLFKRAPAVLITHSLGALTHSTQHVAVHVWKYTSASGGWKKNSRTHLSALVRHWLLLVCNRLYGWPLYLFNITF